MIKVFIITFKERTTNKTKCLTFINENDAKELYKEFLDIDSLYDVCYFSKEISIE